jgi:uncharacterized protein YbaP (TraB family)
MGTKGVGEMRLSIVLLRACCAWLLIGSAGVAWAVQQSPPEPSPAVPFAHGRLFELHHPDAHGPDVRSGETPPSYVFATIHSEAPQVLRLPEVVDAALDGTDTLVLEVVPDAAAMQAAARAMHLGAGESLSALLPATLYRQCVERLAARGLPEAAVAGLKPWAVMTLLSMPAAQTGEFLDRSLFRRAERAGKPVIGLETSAEQLALFDTLSAADQQALLRAALAAQGEREQRLAALTQAYLRGDLGALLAMSEAPVPGLDAGLRRRFRTALIDARNARMLRRIQALPAQGGYFIAVGALHLPGDTGLLRGLQQAGYEVLAVD